jgi:cellulose synthase/poly-beta-1,6-N-acetylglucosamine synthase-like glycosyltransferase
MIDVVIPTRNEWTLQHCIKALKRSVPINNLILVAPSYCREQLEKYDATIVVFDEKNVGKARSEGLKLVETPLYASVDSDVLVTPEWFKWCMKTIKKTDVAACQGYAKTESKYYAQLQIDYIKRGGKHDRGFCCLGNTLLKTEVIHEVGMPEVRVEEDWILRLKVEEAGYKWISNLDLVCQHLKTDVDVWKHAVWWGKMGGDVPVRRCLARIPYHLTFGMAERTIPENLFLVGLQIHLLYGKFRGLKK